MYLYNIKFKDVVRRFKMGLIDVKEAYTRIGQIEEKAYEEDPDAEPDGDITYAASFAVDKIRNWEESK